MRTFDGMSDADMLARIMDAEAAQEGVGGKLAVAAVIRNRAKTGGYGDGIRGVITKPGQFSAINDVTGYAKGQGANQIFWRTPSKESQQIAQAVLAGNYEDPTGGATHYFNPDHADPKWAKGKQFNRIGNHVFGNADAGRVQGGGGSDTLAGQGEEPKGSYFSDRLSRQRKTDGKSTAPTAAEAGGYFSQRFARERPATKSDESAVAGESQGPAPELTESGMPSGMVELPNGHVLDTNAFAEHALKGGDLGDHITSMAGNYLQGIPFIGEYADEAVGAMSEALGGTPGLRKELARAFQSKYQELYPNRAMGAQITGGVATTLPYLFAAAPAAASAAPASTAGKVATGLAVGAGAGAVEGGVSGFGAGNDGDRLQSAQDRAIVGGAVGGGIGAAAPIVAKGVGTVVERFTGNNAHKVARQEGVSDEAVDIAGRMIENDGGRTALKNLDAPDAMVADAGPATAGLLDATIQKAGSGARVARKAIDGRAVQAADDINVALNAAFGPVGPGREVIVKGQKNPLGRLYDIAYKRPIDYSSPAGREIEGLMDRVPADVIRRADKLMSMEGVESAQRLIRVGDGGEEIITALPDVRQLDYITRSLNDVAKGGDGKGALGGNTNEGRVFAKLSREIRTNLKEAVPEWARAVDRAANEIGIKEARELGETAMRDQVSRGDLVEAVEDMGQAELRQLRRGVREYIDDTLAKVKRTAVDANTEAREGLAALKALSSRASRQKLNTILGQKKARELTTRLDRAGRAFELRARTADNSKTFARQSMDEVMKDVTDPGVIGKMLEGSPVQSGRRLLQRLTNMTPEARRAVEEKLSGEIASLLTSKRGPSARTALLQISKSLARDEAGRALAGRLRKAAGALTVSTGPSVTQQLSSP